MATPTGFHYLARIINRIDDETEPTAVENRATRQGNTYMGGFTGQLAGVRFEFKWTLKRGNVDIAAQTSSQNFVKWWIGLNGKLIDQGEELVNSTAGQALLLEIGKAETILAKIQDDDPGVDIENKINNLLTQFQQDVDNGTITPSAFETLADYYTSIGL